MPSRHVMPTDDLVEHDPNEDCVCQPTPIATEGGFIYRHHSLDGRELLEANTEDG